MVLKPSELNIDTLKNDFVTLDLDSLVKPVESHYTTDTQLSINLSVIRHRLLLSRKTIFLCRL